MSCAIGLDPLANRNFTISGSTSRSFGYDSFNRLGGLYFNGALTGDYRSNALNQRVTTLRCGRRNAARQTRACQLVKESVAGAPALRARHAGGAPARE